MISGQTKSLVRENRHPLFADRALISKNSEIDFENFTALQCGMAKFSPAHAILSWRFELG
jgi:hypothetical protein